VLDTQSSPFHDGPNQIQACAVDYATTSSPNIGCAATKTVQVDNSCPASKVPGGSDLTARFPRSDKDTVTVRSRKSALMTGRLTDRSGDPLEGATLCMSEATPGAQLTGVGTVKTNEAGRYRYTVGPGPNREVDVAYRFNRHELHRIAHYRAKVIPSLKLSSGQVKNGRRIHLFGRLPGPRNQDRIVVLQARYPGKNQRWKTFQKARTDQEGQYTAPYRFLSTFVTTEYEMRAVAPRQNGYPFLAGQSRVRHIRVTGR
jgi:protocatechuate 3,4-dioxygenase beta subunit